MRVSIDLSRLEEEPLAFAEDLELEVDRLDPDVVAAPVKVRIEGTVTPMSESFFAQGSLAAEGKLLCTRCLGPVAWERRDSFAVELHLPVEVGDEDVELGEGDMDVIFLDDNNLELSHLAAEQVMLGLPMRILCDPDCAGLCPKCGANKNLEGACTCDPDVDPRWEALKDVQGRTS